MLNVLPPAEVLPNRPIDGDPETRRAASPACHRHR